MQADCPGTIWWPAVHLFVSYMMGQWWILDTMWSCYGEGTWCTCNLQKGNIADKIYSSMYSVSHQLVGTK